MTVTEMREELVKQLRNAERFTDLRITLWGQAADTIEEMQKALDAVRDGLADIKHEIWELRMNLRDKDGDIE